MLLLIMKYATMQQLFLVIRNLDVTFIDERSKKLVARISECITHHISNDILEFSDQKGDKIP